MNWREFLSLAARLASGGAEADWRTAVSRAYYAAFHVARRLFADLNFTVPRADRAISISCFDYVTAASPTWNNPDAILTLCGGYGIERTTMRSLQYRSLRPSPPFGSLRTLFGRLTLPCRTPFASKCEMS